MKKIFVLFYIIACVALMISCGSSPEAAPEPAAPPSVPQPAPAPAPAPDPSVPVDSSAARLRAVQAQDRARSIKADVAVKADFDNALNVFNAAETAADPISAYGEAERLFLASYDKAKVLRDAALSELEKAKNEIKAAEDEAAAYEAERAAIDAAEGAI